MKANSASGMAVNDECKLKFMELKAKRNFRFIIFKIDENIQQVVVDKLGQPDESYEDFTLAFPANECRYAVFDFDFITDEHCQKSKIFFISWWENNAWYLNQTRMIFLLPNLNTNLFLFESGLPMHQKWGVKCCMPVPKTSSKGNSMEFK